MVAWRLWLRLSPFKRSWQLRLNLVGPTSGAWRLVCLRNASLARMRLSPHQSRSEPASWGSEAGSRPLRLASPSLAELESAPVHLETGDVLKICSLIENRPHILVGGQALNFWAEYYAETCPALNEYAPYTSKDIDFYGCAKLAHELAARLNVPVRVATIDDHTASVAILSAQLDGQVFVIDILSDILGVKNAELRRGAVQIEIPFHIDGATRSVQLALMNPIHCFISRAVAVHHPAIRRRDAFALKQLRASVWILIGFLDALADSDRRQAGRWLKSLGHCLEKHDAVKAIDLERELDIDPLEIIESALHDERIDSRFRMHQLGRIVQKVRRGRTLQKTRRDRALRSAKHHSI